VRLLRPALLTLAVAVAAVGALHLPVARHLLARLGGCPVERATAADAERVRQHGLDSLRGASPAPQRPALGLALDATNEADAKRWADQAGLSCESTHRGFDYLKCQDVPAAAVGDGEGTLEELSLAFDPSGRLIGVDALRRKVAADAAGRILTGLSARLEAQLGEPSDSSGELSAAYMAGGPMRTAVRRWRFSDYLASIVATALPWSGIVIHEQYGSARQELARR
jgi:hypothetical protein